MMDAHKQLVRQAFTQQAKAYAASPDILDRERLRRLVDAAGPDPNDRVLEVATGPGYVALAFAERCREVIGVDLTEAPLAIAEENRRTAGLTNVSFKVADADHLPFAGGEFDIVVSRFALHHFQAADAAFREMARVCRTGGKVAIEDLCVSEIAGRGEYQNQFERLRDASHVRAMPVSELLRMFTASGLEVETLFTGELVPSLERWLSNAQTPAKEANIVRQMIEADEKQDLSGTHPFRVNGELFFRQKTAAIVGTKLK